MDDPAGGIVEARQKILRSDVLRGGIGDRHRCNQRNRRSDSAHMTAQFRRLRGKGQGRRLGANSKVARFWNTELTVPMTGPTRSEGTPTRRPGIMANSLIETLSQFISPELISRVATAHRESPSAVTRAFQGALPALLGMVT